ncbi:MAG: hypothetical protein J5797_00405 [Prevotella sp.]|nr:hypothetical protein [Prevotella sp.]
MDRIIKSPIEEYFLEGMYEELEAMFTVKRRTDMTAVIVAKSPFALLLIVNYIANRWRQDGISFNKLHIDGRHLTLKVQTLHDQNLNNMQVAWL